MKNKTVYVVGPSSTGKTTLCNALAKKLNLTGPAVIGEVAREVMVTHGYTRKDVGSLEMQQAIMDAHLKREDEGRVCPILVCDRSAVDPIVYAVMTSPNESEAQRRRDILVHSTSFQSALQQYRRSTFILLAPIAEWLVDDGVRLVSNQIECFEVFRSLLRELGISFQEFGSDRRLLEERVVSTMGLLGL